jgi:cell wall-associated NlpC family hydrolase
LSQWREGAKLSAVTTPIPDRIPGAAHYPGSLPDAPARQRLRPFVAVVLASLLAACGHAPVRSHAQSQVASPRAWPIVTPADPAAANAVLMRALGLVGTPYRYGGNTPEGGFDCSGLVTYVYRDMLDLRLPRTSRELAGARGERVDDDRLAAADLVFFGSGEDVSHVGIYVGEGRFVHAPSTGGTVRLDRLDGVYWRDHFRGALRVLR